MQTLFEDLQYRAPARVAIAARHVQQRLARFMTRTAAVRRVIADWLGAIVLVMAFLLVHGWLARQELKDELAHTLLERDGLFTDRARLQTQLAERTALQNTGGMYFLIEADSSEEARDKLTRASVLAATYGYELSGRETPKAWLP